MKNKTVIFLLAILGIVILINMPPVNSLINLFDQQDINFSNATGSFTFSEMTKKERNDRMCEYKWELFKKTGNTDTLLYRTTARQYWKLWNYGDYFLKKRYAYPFKSWDEIQSNRHPNRVTSGFQDF